MVQIASITAKVKDVEVEVHTTKGREVIKGTKTIEAVDRAIITRDNSIKTRDIIAMEAMEVKISTNTVAEIAIARVTLGTITTRHQL